MKSPAQKGKLHKIIESIITVTIVLAIIESILVKNWTTLFASVLVLILLSLPRIFERRYKIDIPNELEIIFAIFIYASLFLGEVYDFYIEYWWWDIILHASSAIIFGLIGFTILYLLYSRHKVKANPWALAIFSFTFAIAIGAIWEIIEFTMDGIFGLNMQKSGLQDTMWDLIVDAAGALIASVTAYIYFKNKKTPIFKSLANFFKD